MIYYQINSEVPDSEKKKIITIKQMGNRKTITDFMLKLLFIQEGSNRFHFIGQNGLK